MKFDTYESIPSREVKEDRSRPMVGWLIIEEPMDCSDCNLYPNHEVFGVARPCRVPLYAEYGALYSQDERFVGYGKNLVHKLYARPAAVTRDGETEFHYPFMIYPYELPAYLAGTAHLGAKTRIELAPPFEYDPETRGLRGYGI